MSAATSTSSTSTANGGVASLTRTNAQRGVNAAGTLLGAGLWWIRPGANVQPAFSQKYFAIYSQNDWRATSKLTLNLGLRWEVQPGPTERYDRMSAWDLEATNAFGTQGAIAFPGVDGYSRNLWDTTYDNWGPRVGAAYQLNDRMVLRGGFGITYLPSNTGYFSGPTDYGSANFSAGVSQMPYGAHAGRRAGRHVRRPGDRSRRRSAAIRPRRGIYGIGEARFDRHFKNGRVHAVERVPRAAALSTPSWCRSATAASVSRNLLNRSFPIQNAAEHRPGDARRLAGDQYIATNGTLNPATQQVPNPFQPATGPRLPFAGPLAAATLAAAEHAVSRTRC